MRGQKGPLYLKSVTHPTMMKLGTVILYPKKIKKIYGSRDTPLEFCWHQHFSTGNQQSLLCQEIQIHIVFWYIISIYFNFFWVFIDCYKNMAKILKMSAKIAAPALLEIKVFWNKGYCVIYSVYDLTIKFCQWLKLYYGCGHVTKVW